MSSTFFGIEIGSRGLSASQVALNVTGNNTANVNTPGYARQVVNLDETLPYTPPDSTPIKPGELGTGVTVASITSVRDIFLDQRVYSANAQQSASQNLSNVLSQVESAYNEPSDTGIGGQLTSLFNAFSNLSTNAESGALRSAVLDQSQSLVNEFHTVSTSLNQITPEITSNITSDVNKINQIATQLSALNKEIGLSVAAGDTPNDLQDQRGQLLNQLSNLADIQVTYQKNPDTGQPNGEINVTIGGYALVQGNSTNALPGTVTTVNNTPSLQTASGTTIPLSGGELYGLIKAGTLVAGYQSDLDTLAYNLVGATNAIHRAGYGLDGSTNNNFFTPLSQVQGAAASIAVDPGVLNNPNKIAAATAPAPGATFAPGNGDTARSIAGLASTPVIGAFSLDDYYNAKVAAIGADSQSYQQQATNQGTIVSQLTNQQASASGVNLDEELTKMLQYQRSYQAAARVLNTADAFLNTIINGLGAANATG